MHLLPSGASHGRVRPAGTDSHLATFAYLPAPARWARARRATG